MGDENSMSTHELAGRLTVIVSREAMTPHARDHVEAAAVQLGVQEARIQSLAKHRDEWEKRAKAAEAAVSRDAVRNALGSVLTNIANYPEQVQSRLWGAQLSGLIEKATDAVVPQRSADV